MLFFLYQLWISKIYSFNPNRTLVGLAIIKLLSKLSIFERNLLHEVLKRWKFSIFNLHNVKSFGKNLRVIALGHLACFFFFLFFLVQLHTFCFWSMICSQILVENEMLSVQMLGGYHSLILLYFKYVKMN